MLQVFKQANWYNNTIQNMLTSKTSFKKLYMITMNSCTFLELDLVNEYQLETYL
jgi:hypothetical protein